jgi:hypothetical protein
MRILVADDDLVSKQLIADALGLLAEGKPGAERALAQAVYWLGRVATRSA